MMQALFELHDAKADIVINRPLAYTFTVFKMQYAKYPLTYYYVFVHQFSDDIITLLFKVNGCIIYL